MATLEEVARQQGILPSEEQKAKDLKGWKTTEINGKRVDIKMLKGRTKGIGTAMKLKKIALPLIGRGFDGLQEDDYLEPPKTFTEMAVILSDQMERTDIDSLIFEDLLAEVKVDGELITDWDDYLMCNYGELIPMLAFAVKENFSSFFTGVGLMKKLQAHLQNLWVSEKGSQEESTNKE